MFPGLAVAETLKERGHEVLLIVSEKSIDSVALQAHPDFRYEKLPSVGMPSMLSPAFVRFLRRSWESYGHCGNVYRKFRPAVVLGMGGFTSTAPLLAGWRQKLPNLHSRIQCDPRPGQQIRGPFCHQGLAGFQRLCAEFPRPRNGGDRHAGAPQSGTPLAQGGGARRVQAGGRPADAFYHGRQSRRLRHQSGDVQMRAAAPRQEVRCRSSTSRASATINSRRQTTSGRKFPITSRPSIIAWRKPIPRPTS